MARAEHKVATAPAIREMMAADLPAVLAIEKDSFTLPWSPTMIGDELEQEAARSTVAVAAEAGDRVVGFLLGRRYPDVWHVMDVAVAPAMRRQGIARALVSEFVAAACLAGRGVLLEVRGGNEGAVALYGSLGFVTAGVRRRYYPDTGEDALVMMRGAGVPDSAAGPCDGATVPGGGGAAGPLLAIESSCDDSAAAVLTPSGEVLASVSHSQDAIHERYGGVVPEVASRAHVERMTAVVREALRQAGCGVADLGGVAVTVGPGLIGALLVGVQTAKAIAWSRKLPFYPVNHLHGHLAAAWLSDPSAPLPMVTLVASGGHTMLVRVDGHSTFSLLGQTLDDAAGEAFDKGARLLGLGYPGGRELDQLAETGDPDAFSFPFGLRRSVRPDFSFSGVKTALYYQLRGMTPQQREERAADIAASYRRAVVGALVAKTVRTAEHERVKTIAVVGGVAANSLLRRQLAEQGQNAGFHVVVPAISYCTDNAAMIGAAALSGLRIEYPDYLGIDAAASMPLGRLLP